ncbi:MAG TPA: hypothetical protein VMF08_05620 [Candidatus Sulfotelmatobacter sp.]|nr:hypothetical protein [Candidatus Sulfotelmatobacter sp.]
MKRAIVFTTQRAPNAFRIRQNRNANAHSGDTAALGTRAVVAQEFAGNDTTGKSCGSFITDFCRECDNPETMTTKGANCRYKMRCLEFHLIFKTVIGL